jgi:hypothetical protein
MNDRMRRLAALATRLSPPDMPPSLIRILSEGWVRDGDACLLKAMIEGSREIKLQQFPDLTGYEAFINQFHLDEHLPSAPLEEVVQTGLAFAERMLSLSRSELAGLPIYGILVVRNANESTLRFHRVRPGEEWLARDLESYVEEAIAVLSN